MKFEVLKMRVETVNGGTSGMSMKIAFLEHDVIITKDVAYFNAEDAIYAIKTENGKLP